MALDDTIKNSFADLLDKFCQAASATLSASINAQASINVTDISTAVSALGTVTQDEKTVLLQSKLSDSSLGNITLFISAANAAQIAGAVMGEETSELDDTGLGAFGSVAAEIFGQLAGAFEFLQEESFRLEGFEPKLIEAGPDGSIVVENPGGLEKSGLKFNIQTEDGKSFDFALDIANDLVNALLMVAGISSGAAAGSDAETVGDVLGADFAEIIDTHDPDNVDEQKNLNLLLDIRMGLIVELGRAEMHLKDILKLTKGSIIELDRLSGEPVDLFVNNKLIARGEVVVIDDNFGLRITQLAGTMASASEIGLLGGDDG